MVGLQFAPTYHEYVLYNHTEGDDGARKYRSRTFVPTGQEMDTLRKNRYVFGGNRLDEIHLSSPATTSSPKEGEGSMASEGTDFEFAKSSLLVDTSESPGAPYDMSIIDLDMSNYPTEVPAAAAAANEGQNR